MRLRGRAEAGEGGDRLALDGADGRDARAGRPAVDVHRARAALREAAPELGIAEAEVRPQRVEQRHGGIGVESRRFAIDDQPDSLGHGGLLVSLKGLAEQYSGGDESVKGKTAGALKTG